LEQEKAVISVALDDAEEAYTEKCSALEDTQHANIAMVESLNAMEEKNAAILGGREKITDQDSCIAAIGMVLANALAVIMKYTKPINTFVYFSWLHFWDSIIRSGSNQGGAWWSLQKIHFYWASQYFYQLACLKRNQSIPCWRFELQWNWKPMIRWKSCKTSKGNLTSMIIDLKGIPRIAHFRTRGHSSPSKRVWFRWGVPIWLWTFFWFFLKTFGLDDIAQRDSVEVSITPDGAELCDGLCHLTAGIKVTDPRAVDPRDGKRLSCFGDGMGCIFSTKSCHCCFAVKSLLGKDSKEAYQEFSDFFLPWENNEGRFTGITFGSLYITYQCFESTGSQ